MDTKFWVLFGMAFFSVFLRAATAAGAEKSCTQLYQDDIRRSEEFVRKLESMPPLAESGDTGVRLGNAFGGLESIQGKDADGLKVLVAMTSALASAGYYFGRFTEARPISNYYGYIAEDTLILKVLAGDEKALKVLHEQLPEFAETKRAWKRDEYRRTASSITLEQLKAKVNHLKSGDALCPYATPPSWKQFATDIILESFHKERENTVIAADERSTGRSTVNRRPAVITGTPAAKTANGAIVQQTKR